MAGLLLLLVIVGIRASGPAVGGRGPWQQHALIIGIGLEAALAVLQIGLAIRGRRATSADPLPAILRRDLRRVAGAVMIAIVLIAGASALGDGFSRALPHSTQPAKGKAKPLRLFPRPAHGGQDHLGYLRDALLALLLVAAIAVGAFLFARMRPRSPGGYPGEVGDETAGLRNAIESGRAALRGVDDARAAIIACYLAMEGSLAKAGAARTAAETPDELLTKAATTGLLRGPAARQLTGLFYEARFSSHDLPDTVKDDARLALDAISAELRDPAAAAPRIGPATEPDPAGPGPSR
jgi:hypothetical protein